MISSTFRFLGFWLLAAAIIAFVVDGTKTIAASALVWTPLAQTWAQLHANSLTWLQGMMERNLNPLLWNPGFTSLLRAPTVAVLSCGALLMLWVGRPHRNILDP